MKTPSRRKTITESLESSSLMMALEPRLMYDGAGLVTGIEGHLDAEAQASDPVFVEDAEVLAAPEALERLFEGYNPPADRSSEIVFVDAAVDNPEALLGDVAEGVEIIRLDADRDGVDQISAALADRTDVSAVHIVSHGGPGSLSLGSGMLNGDTMDDQSAAITAWANSLTDDADIMIYGCNVAEGEDGAAFVDALAALTSADVAASTDTTGPSSLGGDLDLEAQTGPIEADLIISAAAMEGYGDLLETTSAIGVTGDEETVISFTQSDFTDSFSGTLTSGEVVLSDLPDPDTEGELRAGATIINDGVNTTYVVDYADLGDLTFSPIDDFDGTVSFDWDGATDTTGDTYTGSTSAITVTVDNVNDTPTPVADGPYTTNEDETLTTGDVLDNDTDPDDDTLRYRDHTDPTYGSVTYNGDGTFTYVPDPDWNGTDTFTYSVIDVPDDEDGGLTATATVTITVSGVNDIPSDGEYSLGADMVTYESVTTTAATTAFNAYDVKAAAEASDPDGDETYDVSTVTITEGPYLSDQSTDAPGTLSSATDADGYTTWTFTPEDDTLDAEDFNGEIHVAYSINTESDESGDTATGWMVMKILPRSDVPLLTITAANGAMDTVDVDTEDAAGDGDGVSGGIATIQFNGVNVDYDGDGNDETAYDSLAEGGTLTFDADSELLLTFSDVDLDEGGTTSDQVVTLSLSTDNAGTLTLAQTTGLTFNPSENGSDDLSLSGSLANVNAALDGMVYAAEGDFTGTETITITFDDSESRDTGTGLKVETVQEGDTASPEVTIIDVADFHPNVGTGDLSDLESTYFTLSSPNGDYYVYFDVDDIDADSDGDPDNDDPGVTSATGISVSLTDADAATTIVDAMVTAITAETDFVAAESVIDVTDSYGTQMSLAARPGTDYVQNETITLFADADDDANDTDDIQYYVWFNVDSDGTDPALTGMTGIEVAIDSTDTAAAVAATIQPLLDAEADLTAAIDTSKLAIINADDGAVTATADGDVGAGSAETHSGTTLAIEVTLTAANDAPTVDDFDATATDESDNEFYVTTTTEGTATSAEVTTVTFKDAAADYDAQYFLLAKGDNSDATYFWFDFSTGTVDPDPLADFANIGTEEIAIDGDTTAEDVATSVAAVVTAHADYTATVASDGISVTITAVDNGDSWNATDGVQVAFANTDFDETSGVFTDVEGDALDSVTIDAIPSADSGVLFYDAAGDDLVEVAAGDILSDTELDTLIFLANPEFNGTDTFEWTAADDNGSGYSTAAGTVTLTIDAVSDDVNASWVAETDTIYEDSAETFDILANITDIDDGDSDSTISYVSDSAVLTGAAGETGIDFTTTTAGDSSTAAVTTLVFDNLTASEITYLGDKYFEVTAVDANGEPAEYYVWFNDTDGTSTDPGSGVSNLEGKTGVQVDFASTTDTTDAIATAVDGELDGLGGIITADNTTAGTVELTNDNVGDVTGAEEGNKGTLSELDNLSGWFSYTPGEDTYGLAASATIVYNLYDNNNDGGSSATAVLVEDVEYSISVTEVNDAPTVSGISTSTVSVFQDTQYEVPTITISDSDYGSNGDTNAVEVTITAGNGTLDVVDQDFDGTDPVSVVGEGTAALTLTGSIVSINNLLALTRDADGYADTYAATSDLFMASGLLYTPDEGYTGADTISVLVDDNNATNSGDGTTGEQGVEAAGSATESDGTTTEIIRLNVVDDNIDRPITSTISKTGSEDNNVSFTEANFTSAFTDSDDTDDELTQIQIASLPVDTSTTSYESGFSFLQNQEGGTSAAEIASFTTVADEGNSLDGKYFTFTSIDAASATTDYYVWMNPSDAATDPGGIVADLTGMTGIEVNSAGDSLDTDATAAEAATAIAAVINADASDVYAYADNLVQLTSFPDGTDGDAVVTYVTTMDEEDYTDATDNYVTFTHDGVDYFAWFDDSTDLTTPSGLAALAGYTEITVPVTETDSATAVADALAEVLNTLDGLAAVHDSDDTLVTITDTETGAVTTIAEGSGGDSAGDIYLSTDTDTALAVGDTVDLADLDDLYFDPAADFNGTATFTFKATDAQADYVDVAATTISIATAAINDAPEITADFLDSDGVVIEGQEPEVDEEDQLVFSAANGNEISLEDVDSGVEDVTIVLTAENGSITLSQTNNLTGSGDGTSSLSYTGPAPIIDAALNGLTYVGDTDFEGTDTITLTVSDEGNVGDDGATGTHEVTFDVTVNGVDDVPVATNDTVTTNEDVSVAVSVVDNDDMVDSDDTYTISLESSPTNGTVTVNASSGVITYTPTDDYSGADSFTYSLSDGTSTSNTGTVNVTVTSVNDTPDAANDVVAMDDSSEDTEVTIQVKDNDSDVDDDIDDLFIPSFTQPTYGTLVYNGNGSGSFTYTVGDSFPGEDTFTYTLSDSSGGTSVATVTLSTGPVLNVPSSDQDVDEDDSDGVAIADIELEGGGSGDMAVTISTAEAGTITLSSTTDLEVTNDGTDSVTLEGDRDAINDALLDLTYVPYEDFNGTDTITFAVTGDEGSNTQTISVTVAAINDPATVEAPTDGISVSEASSTTLSDVSIGHNDTGDLEVTVAVDDGTMDLTDTTGLVIDADETTTNTTTITFTGSLDDVNTALTNITYTPDTADNGGVTNTLTVTVSDNGNTGTDGLEYTTTETIDLVVAEVNDTPTLTVPDNLTATEDENLTLSGVDEISITDADASETVTATLSVFYGELTANSDSAATVTTDSDGIVTIDGTVAQVNNALDGLIYLGESDFHGFDRLDVVVEDSQGATDTQSVNIYVESVNDTPEIISNIPDQEIDQDSGSLTISDILDYFEDADDPDQEYMFLGEEFSASNGTVVRSDSTTIIYTPDDGFYGNDTVYFDVMDLYGGTVSSSLDITVNEVIADPTATDDSGTGFTTTEGTAFTTDDILDNDEDADGTNTDLEISLASYTTDSGGTLVNHGDGTFTYSPPSSDFWGDDTFTYTIIDDGDSDRMDTATVTLTVNAVNDTPTVTIPSSEQYLEEANSLTLSETNGNAVSVGDVDVANSEGTGAVRVHLEVGDGTMTLSSTSGLAFDGDNGEGDGTDDATMDFTGALTDIQTALDGLVYTPDSDFTGYESLDITVYDLNSDTASVDIVDADSATSSIDIVSDVDSSLHETYLGFTANDTSYYVWFDIGGGATDPAPDGYDTGIEVTTVTANMDATDIAAEVEDAIQTQLDTDDGGTATADTLFQGNTGAAESATSSLEIMVYPEGTTPPTLDTDGDSLSSTDTTSTTGATSTTSTLGAEGESIADENPPTATDDSFTGYSGYTLVTDPVTDNDTNNAGGDELYIFSWTQPTNGSAVYNGSGVFTYTPDTGFSGTDTFTYQVNDAAGGFEDAIISIEVLDETPPTGWADGDEIAMLEDEADQSEEQMVVAQAGSVRPVAPEGQQGEGMQAPADFSEKLQNVGDRFEAERNQILAALGGAAQPAQPDLHDSTKGETFKA